MARADGLWTSFSKALSDALYPSRCALCGLLRDSSPCPSCASQMEPARPDFLGEPAGSSMAYRACVFAYSGRAAQAVRKLKYSRSTSLSDFMADSVAKRLREVGSEDALVIPVPLHRSKHSFRGFNQALVCASGNHGMTIDEGCLKRVRATRPQAGLSLKERERNLLDAFKASDAVAGRNVILVDDVVTSGNTARACAKALREAGCASVGIVAFCGNLD